jgi:hypothetical protein
MGLTASEAAAFTVYARQASAMLDRLKAVIESPDGLRIHNLLQAQFIAATDEMIAATEEDAALDATKAGHGDEG